MEGRSARGELRVFSTMPTDWFERGFREIYERRMKDLPIVNPKLTVEAVAFRRWQNDWFGMMVTPWMVAAVYACGVRKVWPDIPAGKTRTIELPAGDFDFTMIDDDVLGRYLMLSLKSPVTDLEDQEAARLFGKVAFDAMLTAQSIPEDDEDAVAWVPPTADGALRRVIPIKVMPPKDVESTPVLTPQPESEEEPEPFFERSVSRRSLFSLRVDGSAKKAHEAKKAAPKKTDAKPAHAPPKQDAEEQKS